MVIGVRQGHSRMALIIPGHRARARVTAAAGVLLGGWLLAACGNAPQIPAAEQPLANETLTLLAKKGMTAEAPIFVRIFKEESELELWKARDDNRFYHFKTYPICNWSGELGPKMAHGDKQAPEGFYTVQNRQMNPNSQFHVAFNLGYPNVYDRAHKRTGEALMVHGKCISAGCYAMTDALMEEIYAIAREAFRGGQESFDVHAFPFRMTGENMARHKTNKWYPFWVTLRQGYNHFEAHRLPPGVAVCERRYVVNVSYPGKPDQLRADQACPRFDRPMIEPFVPKPAEQQLAEERIVVAGPKLRAVASAEPPTGVALAGTQGGPSTSSPYGLGSWAKAAGSALGFAP